MSAEQAQARPSQVTVAGWAVAAASVVLVVAVFDTMGRLHSVEMRERITEVITSGSASGMGLTVERATELLRWSLMVAAVAAVAAGIFGVFVLRRDRAARIGLTIAAVPAVLTAPVAGSLPGMVIGAGAALLWSRPARDWFAGRPVTRPQPVAREVRPSPVLPPAPPVAPPVLPPPTGAPAPLPPPTPGWGRHVADVPALALDPLGRPIQRGGAPLPATPVRPPVLGWACLLVWAFCAVTAVGALIAIAAILANADAVRDYVVKSDGWDQAMDPALIVPATVTMAVLVLLWSVAAAVLAVFTWRGRPWAWGLLIASTVVAALLSALAVLSSPGMLVYTAACGLVLGWLLRRQTRDWINPPRPPRFTPPAGPTPGGPVPPR